jgi:hypothetical protein
MIADSYSYQVINVEQHGEDIWSTHRSLAAAQAAKRRYEKSNPISLREPSLAFRIEIVAEA